MTKSLILTALFAALALSTIDAAQAQGRGYGDGRGPVGQVCARDIDAYCAGIRHGNRGVRNCLNSHRPQVSRACRAALDGTSGGRGWQ
ncbi:hypothetical protein HNR60_001492 [Rhodopseudomonas rhenobacensis]|uniref:Cysteine rich repeat-containing protein n=1 Tax=Rhodopseudomonas rhenobacensis TaxID=87461 RepID=A0A7W8DXZ2_9BRAD|nr:hypothetical protein [Rhodopseudomonas rhenobacensis]MBB5046744.1 hypothetical protein [Rhodopseudomonas rhenobacensis]